MMNELQKQIVIAMAENDMCIDRVAKATNYCRTNVQYHINRIKEITGLNPRKFFDMIKLYEMVTGGLDNGNEENL
jgi:sugar diacid utilization regulator